MKIGLRGGMKIRNANLTELLFPALLAVAIGVIIVFLGKWTLGKLPGIKPVDAIVTAGLFGAVSASTFAAAMLHLKMSVWNTKPVSASSSWIFRLSSWPLSRVD